MSWSAAASEPTPDAALGAAFRGCLPGGRLGGPLLVSPAAGSTQDVCRRLAGAGPGEGSLVLANSQTTGRGQHGRQRVAPPAPARRRNDALAGGRKPAGVLAEGVVGSVPFVVLGVGVNVAEHSEQRPAEPRARAVSVADLVEHPVAGRPAFLRSIPGHLAARSDAFLVNISPESPLAAWS